TSMRREPPMMNPVDRCQVAARAARVLLSSAMLVLVPAIAAAAAPDHFACYKAAYAPNAAHFTAVTGINLVDAFGSSTVTVKKPHFLCAPSNKNGEDPSAPSDPDHLTDFLVK